MSLLRQQKNPENSGTVSETSLRSSHGDFSLHREKHIKKHRLNSPQEFKKVKAPQKCCHVTATFTNKVLHISQSPVGRGPAFSAAPPPPHTFGVQCSPLHKFIKRHEELPWTEAQRAVPLRHES